MGLLDGKIAKQVAAGLKSAGLTKPCSLIRPGAATRSPTSPSTVTLAASTTYTCRGFVAAWRRERLGATIVQASDRVVAILGATLAVVPEIGDQVAIEGETGRVVDIERDPAGALYNCLARG